MTRITWTRSAVSDLQQIRQLVAEDDPTAAERLARRILQAVDRLSTFPDSGRRGRVRGTRELPIPGTPYIIPYQPRGEQLVLLRVLHGRQHYP